MISHEWGPTRRIGQFSHSQKFTSSGAPCSHFRLMLRNRSGISRASIFQPQEAEVENLAFPPTPLTRPHTAHHPKNGRYLPHKQLCTFVAIVTISEDAEWILIRQPTFTDGNTEWKHRLCIKIRARYLLCSFRRTSWMARSLSSLCSVNTKVSPEVL